MLCRITSFLKVPKGYEFLENVAVYQYKGHYPGDQDHGGRTVHKDRHYTKTPIDTREKMNQNPAFLFQPPKKTYDEVMADTGDDEKLRNPKSVRNAKYYAKKQSEQFMKSGNLADQFEFGVWNKLVQGKGWIQSFGMTEETSRPYIVVGDKKVQKLASVICSENATYPCPLTVGK